MKAAFRSLSQQPLGHIHQARKRRLPGRCLERLIMAAITIKGWTATVGTSRWPSATAPCLVPRGLLQSEKGNTMLDRTTRSTKDVIDNHLQCFGTRNLEGILSDYAATAVLFTQQGVLKGPSAIKPLF